MKKTVWIAVAFVVLVVGFVVVSTFRQPRFRCRVCITFNSRQDCRTVSAATREEARQTATINACSQLSGGIIQANQCESTPPDSVDWLP